GLGRPIIDASGKGSAITISAGGSTLLGFMATGSGRGSEDAGIRVLSNGNILKDNVAFKNNNYGIIPSKAEKNTVFLNSATENQKGGILLAHSDNNQIWGNYAGRNEKGISIETSRGNTIHANNLTGNALGISISSYNFSESIVKGGKGATIQYGSSKEVAVYNISEASKSAPLPGANILYDNLLQDNSQDSFDDGHNQWDNDTVGNHYSNFDSREQGCKDRNRDGICDSGYSIPGGSNEDRYPIASPDAILSYRSRGREGFEMKMGQRSYLPGSDVGIAYQSPGNFSGWAGVMKANHPGVGSSQKDALSYQSLAGPSGKLNLKAPSQEGSYDIRMYNMANDEVASLLFNVSVPTITATPASLNTCEQITINYIGAPGFENDWIAMYESNSTDNSFISRQYLDGNENGTVLLYLPDPGSYILRMFQNDSYTELATSNSIEVKEFSGRKVIATPSHVAPGGIVTVTYWGAPASGTGIIGMYGVSRPDKFALEKRALGSKNCGRMTWQLPYEPGNYDFRMFYSDITSEGQGAYQLLGQSNGVTVG
ncbi:MAG: NosD domain-containing protein, partial [Syntrophomonas sp.]|nr:NosD domain-containing protein [Syntrophomonas sp.]